MNREEIERRARLALPSSISDLQVHSQSGGINDAIWLRASLPAGEVDDLLQAAGFDLATLTDEERLVGDHHASDLGWWTPNAVTPFRSTNLIKDGDYASNVLVGEPDDETGRCAIYLFVMEL